MAADGSSTAAIRSGRGYLSPTEDKSGPALLAVPSTEWHWKQAARWGLLNTSRPRPGLPSWPMAKSRYSRGGRVASVGDCAAKAVTLAIRRIRPAEGRDVTCIYGCDKRLTCFPNSFT